MKDTLKGIKEVVSNAVACTLLCASIGLTVVGLYKQVKYTAEYLDEKKFIK